MPGFRWFPSKVLQVMKYNHCCGQNTGKIGTRLLVGAVISCLIGGFAGCVPIQRVEWRTTNDQMTISPERKYISVSVLTDFVNPDIKPHIDTNNSFAISPAGKRFRLKVQNNEFADEYAKTNPTPWMLKELYLVDPAQNKPVAWKNGDWKLSLYFTGTKPSINTQFSLYSFWYCPFFMRPF
jgi:hypothetical protein